MPDKVVEGYQLSPQQARIWLLQQLDGGLAYRAQCAVLIDGDLDVGLLRGAIREIVARHEILRTDFHLLAGMTVPLQSIGTEPVAAFREIDLSDCDARQKSARFEEIFQEEAADCLDFERGSHARFCLVRMSVAERILVVSAPAVCADSRSLKNLFREVARAYGAQGRGGENTERPAQYVDFVEWQRERLERGERLRGGDARPGVSPELKLGLERESERGSKFAPKSVRLALDGETVGRIDRLSEAHRITPDVFLLACWQVLMWRLSGNKEVRIDSLCEGRGRGKLQQAMGVFASYSPAQCHLEPDYRLEELLETVERSWRAARLGVDQMLREERETRGDGGVARRAGAIGFWYEEWPGAEREGGVKFSYWRQYCCIDRFKLKLGAYRREEGLEIEIEHDPSIYGRESVELMGERYEKVIQSALRNEAGQIGDWEVIGERELERLTVGWNRTERGEGEGRCIHELIGEQARIRGEAIAVSYREEQLSFAELERRAGQLAGDLRRKGVRPESVVGLYGGRSTEMMIGLLGILKAGGAYLPLEVGHPGERLRAMLEESGARVVVTRSEDAWGLPWCDSELVMVDGEGGEREGCGEEEEGWSVSAENLAYVIYTSGSTGRPKGVMVRHGAVVNLLKGLKETVYEGEEEGVTVSLNAPLSFDASVKQVIQMAEGSRLCIVPEEDRVDGREMLKYLRRNGVEVMDCTPSQWRVLKEGGLEKSESEVRRVLVGGEAIDEESWREMRESREISYYNVYGPTECTVDATACGVKEYREPTIGRPIRNTRIYILDERGGVSPTGVTGEIYIGGEGLGRGYIGDARQTAEKFVPDPYVKVGGERMYRTGDRGRYVEGGRIEYEGRRDGQVKVRGHRVELGEIEEVLRSYPGVREAVVIVREDDPWQKRLVGYVAGRQEWGVEGKRRRLPNGMVIAEQNKNETEYLYEEIFRKKSYFKHGINLPQDGCVFDIGANIGLFTLFVSQNRKGARVYAFEPIKPIYETLRMNAQLYGGAGVKVYQVGLGEEEGKEWYTYYRGYSMMSGERRYATATEDIEVIKSYLRNEQTSGMRNSLLKEADDILSYRFEEEQYECQVKRLTDVIREEGVERIDILKVDVQRAEMNVLRGLGEADWKKINQIVMEVHDQEGSQTEGRLEEIRRLLKAKGYKVTIEQDELLSGTDRYNLYARRLGGRRKIEEQEWVEMRGDETWDEISEEKLRKYVRESLPDYMTPAVIVVMEELPLTRNGKIDRGALPRPEEVKKRSEIEESEHRNAYEEIINGVWKAVLKVERVGRRDSFFEIGGDSLSTTQVIARVRDVFGVEIGIRSIFNNPTIEGLARVVEEAMRAGERDAAPPLVRASREERLPLSFAQQRLWFIDQLEPGSAVYNCPGAVKLTGRLNLEALERVVNEVVRRHEVLRTRIEVEEGEPAQVIDEWEPRRLEVEDLTNLPRETREEEIGRRLREEAEIGFDLSRGPLLRVKVLKVQEDEHVALFTMHHIVCDAWSMQILSREVGTLYQEYSAGGVGGGSPLAELPIQYADFAVWQREWLKGEVLEEKLAYWREQLAGMEDLELPTDHPRPPAPSYRGASRSFVVERELAERLRELSRREGATLFMTLLGGFNVLMSRYSWQTDVAIGTDIANRNRAEIEGLIGFFVNQLVLRVEVRARESFVDFVKRVRDVCLGAYAHQDLPFEKLVEELRPERDLSRSPLFQVKLIWQNAPGEGLELGEVRPVSGDGGEVRTANDARSARFDLTVSITDGGHDLVGAVIYSRDLFEEGTIERLISHYTNVLRGIVDDSESPIFSLSLLSAEERSQIVVGWNETGKPYPDDRRIHELIAEQAERTPERIALVYEGQQVSYGELNRRANQLGNYLRRLGVGPEVVVGVCLERSMEMVVAVLGALKAGGAYLPLDPGTPAERMGYMLEDAGAVVVLTDGRLEERLPAVMAHAVLMDEEREKISKESESGLESEVGAKNLAYVIYTSGSSGRPKGVMIEHRGLRNLAEAQKAAFGLEGQSRVLQFASLSFDASISEIFTTLISGGRLHVYAQQSLMSGDELVKVLKEAQITTVTLPPTVLAMLPHEELLNLQTLIAAGEACVTEIVERWARGRKFLNAYGPTEVTVCASIGECKAGNDRSPTIGRPMANTQLYILDHEMEPFPAEVRGELYISGIGLARGYLGRPDLTAERFLPNLFSGEGGERLYRTGDLGRYLSDGNVEFMGRSDGQVKIRGCRVELGEVEAVLNEHRSVKQSAVVAGDSERGGRRLLGYVVVEDGATAAELKKHARERLPEYMVPESILVMKEMPVTASGKIDRKRLPLMKDVGRQVEQPYIGARTPVDEILVGIFEDVLKLSRIGICDNFFEIGGHSLLATQVISRVRKVFGVEVGVKRMFEDATVEGLARAIEEAMRAGEQDGAPPLVRVSREERLPLSFAQQRLWFTDQLEPGSAVYNCPLAVKLTGRLNLEALERAINDILRRHEVLRTRINVVEGEPSQVIDEWEPRTLPMEDLTSLTPEEKEETVYRLAGEDAATGFDLMRGPLLRMKVLKLGEEEHVALFTMHHIVSDGWSMGILIREVKALYEAYCAGEESPLKELPIQYADFAVWQRSWIRGEALENQLSYWKRQLGGKRLVLELPADRPRPVRPTDRGAQHLHTLSTTLSSSLKALSLQQNCTLFMTLLTAFKTLLYYLTGQTEISVGTDIANRNRVETERLIGFFVNQLALHTELSGDLTFEELLRKVRETTLGAYAHQDLPFEKLVEALNPDRSESRTPLFQVKMVLQNAQPEELSLSGLTLSPIGIMGGTAKFDLLLNLRDTEHGINASLQYSSDLFEESTPKRILNRFHTLLDRIVERPDAKLQELIEALIEADQAEQLEKERELGRDRLSTLKSIKRKVIGETRAETEHER